MSELTAQATESVGPARSRYVSRMFGRIAPRYDLMNTLMTFGQDRRWRRRTARMASGESPGMALDLGTGSGELAFELASRGCRVVGMDFCQPMIVVARRKLRSRNGELPVFLTAADALRLPFPDETFDCMTAGFALRNLADLSRGLGEIRRVLKPGGRLAALELTPPTGRISKFLHGLYSHRLVPLLGALVAGDSAAYTYLPESVDRFPNADTLKRLMVEAGFPRVSYRKLGLGMVAIHLAEKER